MLEKRLRKLEETRPPRGSLRELVEGLAYGQKVAALSAVRARDCKTLATVLNEAGFTLQEVQTRFELDSERT